MERYTALLCLLVILVISTACTAFTGKIETQEINRVPCMWRALMDR